MLITILFICTGNTCRSPMAQAMLQEELQQADIGRDQVQVLSAGIFASDGEKAMPQAADAMKERGLSLENHRSRRLTPKLINEAHLILGMTEEHKQAVLMMDAAASDRVFSLAEYVAESEDSQLQDIPDPFGHSARVYRRTADTLHEMLRKLVKRLMEERMVEES